MRVINVLHNQIDQIILIWLYSKFYVLAKQLLKNVVVIRGHQLMFGFGI